MHILIDAHLAVKKIDGVSRYLIGLLSELPQIDKSIRYTILSLPLEESGLPDQIFAHPNVRRVILNLMGPSPKQHFFARRLVKELNVDLYHHPQFDLPFGVQVPKVVTIHDLMYVFHPEFLFKASKLKRFYIEQCLKYTAKHADRIIAVSESIRQDLTRRFAVKPERVKVIYNGVTIPNSTQTDGASTTTDLSNDFILFAGARRPHKNIQGLIKALAILRNERNIKLDLVVAGQPYSTFKEPETLAEQLGVKEHVHLLDFVSDGPLQSLYKRAKLVAVPSFYEGFGLPVVEAMAYGKPVIASNVSALPEIVGDAGLLVDPHDPVDIASKIQQIVADKHLAEQLSQRALQRAKLFSWQKMAEATLQVYLQALKARRANKSLSYA